jgi:hypothetical protein
MSVEDGWRNRVSLFGVDSLNALDRWRMDNDRREQEHAQARQQREQEQERREQDLAHASAAEQIRAELTALREKHESLRMTVADTMNATADAFGTLSSQRMDLSAEQRAEIHKLTVEVAEMRTETARERASELMAIHRAMVDTVAATVSAMDEKRAALATLISEQNDALAAIKAEVAAELELARQSRETGR